MTRRISHITALALAIVAVAAPSASAIDKDGPNAPNPAAVDLVTPDARDAAQSAPPVNLVSPDARDNGRRETPPIVVHAPALAQSDGFNWLDAGIGAGGLAALLLLGAGTATTVRARRSPAGVA